MEEQQEQHLDDYYNEILLDERTIEIAEQQLKYNEGAPPFMLIDGVLVPTKHLVDPRNGDGLVLEINTKTEEPYLAEFNGDYHAAVLCHNVA